MKRVVWLASYPKSGNTWFRAFLANLLRDPDQPVDINELNTGPVASARGPLDAALGYDSADLTHDEIDRMRVEYYLRKGEEEGAPLYLKVHDAYTFLPDGRPMFPPEVTIGALYFVRNPLDVCVSYAHHSGHQLCDKTLRSMGNPNFCVAGRQDRHQEQLRQKMMNWSGHVLSWADAPAQRVLVVRYEDMKAHTEDTFTAAARFIGLPTEPKRIRKAIEFSRFEELKRQEESKGFRERTRAEQSFFRQGETGAGRKTLTREQIEIISRDHAEVMKRFGYQ